MLATVLALFSGIIKLAGDFGTWFRDRQLIDTGRAQVELEQANHDTQTLRDFAQVDHDIIHMSDSAVDKRLRDKYQRD